jgi:hypothetical protein
VIVPQIIQEMELIMKWDVGSLYLKFKKHWEEKWRPAILKYDTVVRTKKTSAERESPCMYIQASCIALFTLNLFRL